jgi:hypothetical protein
MKWRPIKTAPLDEQVLISYIGDDGETAYVNQAMQVILHSKDYIDRQLDLDLPDRARLEKPHCRWVMAYVAIIMHGGNYPVAHTWKEKTHFPEPTHWMPLPKPCKATKP